MKTGKTHNERYNTLRPDRIEKNCPFFSSFSGGKDSCLALFRAMRAGGVPKFLLNMLTQDGKRSRSHGLDLQVIALQAKNMGIPLVRRSASWDDYEKNFINALQEMKAAGVETGVFGDIDIEEHREWVERVCMQAGIRAIEPLWKQDRKALLEEFLDQGFDARIVAVREGVLDASFLGRTLDRQLIADLESLNVDASGEKGEYHTVVTNGPLFAAPVELMETGRELRDGCWFLRVSIS